ncbi:class F sortase [Streptomyces armeniacus]|uniref:Class F sortase n=1 Tax=Streptomyces armeniacus TaxID=83291 RepID=A0A345XZX4_9ACTN|nr:class F sortase [Streptomyces armeniacus]
MPSRRVFAAAAAASLLAGCGGNSSGGDGPARSGSAPPSAPPSAKASGKPSGRSPGRTAPALRRSVPVSLEIPAIGVDTPVMGLGLAADGTVQVPPVTEHDRAGWYRHSPTPGQVGPSVILGHVSVGSYGDGVFHRLVRLRRGDRVTARLENGTAAVFSVSGVRTVPQAEFPTEDVYGNVGRPELRLITCGGPRTGDGYRDSVIAFAALSSALNSSRSSSSP